MIYSALNTEDLELLRNISKAANACGFHLYLIGGAVRDILLGMKPKDLDITVVGDVSHLSLVLKDRLLCKIVKSQPELKTIKIDFGNNKVIDFASTRKEIYAAKKGMPLAAHFGCSLREDILRRDFSVNSLAISINSNDFGKVIDFVGGQEDLKNKKLRVLHDQSFDDDPTRILRAFKFAHRLGFTLEEHTQQLQDEYLANRDYSIEVSAIRIKTEMFQIFETNSVPIIEDFMNKKIYKVFSDKINNVNIAEIHDLIEKYEVKESAPFIYFACIFFNSHNDGLMQQFNLTRNELKALQDIKFSEKFEGQLSDMEIYQQYSNRSKESLVLEILLKNNNNIKKYLEKLTDVKIEITGADLLIMGVPESRSYSLIFDKVLDEKIKGNLPDKISELRFVRKLLLNNEV